MRHQIRLAVQEQYLAGNGMIEKWDHAQRLGFDAIELRGAGEGRFAARLPELKAAAAAGVPMPTVCVEMLHFVGDFDADRRADALAQMKSQLSVMAEIGGRLAMTPASYGMFSTRLPPFTSPAHRGGGRGGAGRRLRSAGRARGGRRRHDRAGAVEPLREPHDQHASGQAFALCQQIGSDHLGIAADTYHMNIEEADPLGGAHRRRPEAAATSS